MSQYNSPQGHCVKLALAADQDVTNAMLNGEGYCHTNLLQPGQSTTFTVVFSALPNAAPGATRSVMIEAFWNPQDPTGVVRDRKNHQRVGIQPRRRTQSTGVVSTGRQWERQ